MKDKKYFEFFFYFFESKILIEQIDRHKPFWMNFTSNLNLALRFQNLYRKFDGTSERE